MTPGPFVAPARRFPRRRLALLLLVVAAAVAGGWWARRRATPATPPLGPTELVCQYHPEPEQAPQPPPARPLPGPDVWGLLAECLRTHPEGPPHRSPITVAEVRQWVAGGDPVWLDDNAWWFPLSGEGNAEMPSGYYVVVGLDGIRCGGAIVN